MRNVPALLVLGGLLSPVATFAVESRQPVGMADYFEVREASSPRISPDGRRVAYVLSSPDVQNDTRFTTIRLVTVSTREDVALTVGGQRSGQPTWSPSGDRLAFVQSEPGKIRLLVVAAPAFREPTLVAELQYAPVDLAWSPDGRYLAYFAAQPVNGRSPLGASAPPGAKWAKPATIVDAGGFQSPVAMLPPPTEVHLYVIEARTGAVPRRVSAEPLGRTLPFSGAGLAWSRDGRQIYVGINPSADAWRNVMAATIYSVDVETGALRKVSGERTSSHRPQVATNGSLLFECMEHGQGTYFDHRLCVAADDAGPFKFISEDLDRPIVASTWAPDGRGVFGVYLDQGVGKLTYFGLDGRRDVLATTGGGDASSYSSGGALSVSRDGTVAFTFSDPANPSEIAVVRRGQAPRVITQVNTEYLSRRIVNPPDELRYRSADGQFDIHAPMVKPAGFVSGKRYPTIVLLHGGQSSDFASDFDLIPQIFAAHGYVVIMPNYRGSGSYGAQFGDRTDYPKGIESDVIGGVEALIAAGIADPARLFIVGGSGGGLSTGWTIGHTTRFQAAVMWYPPTEFASYVLDAATGPTTMRSTFAAAPSKRPEDYFERSPLSLVDAVKTPTMLIVGTEDRITPVSQSIMYFTALQQRGVASELLIYPGEPHGIRVHPSHTASLVAETLGWFARHGAGMPVVAAGF